MKMLHLKLVGCTVAASLLAVACGPNNAGSAPGHGAAGPKARTVRELGTICPVEMINGKSTRQPPELRAGSTAVIRGWATVADYEQPVPPMVHLVLRLSGSKADADIYAEFGHMPRPDLSTEAKRLQAGYEGELAMPAAGTYQVLVALGDKDWQVVCDSGTSLVVVAGK